jgi:quercetin dioxygenase-like cupin family protein
MADVFAWEKLPARTVIPGFHGRFIHSANMTFALWELEAGAILPEHHHMHEQVVHVHSGELEVVVAGERRVLKGGEVAIIPPNAVHSGKALTAVRVMDAFCPVREDYRDPNTKGVLQVAAARNA